MYLRYELVDGLAHASEVGRERAVDDDAAGAVLGDGHVACVAVAAHEHAFAGKVGAEAMLPCEVRLEGREAQVADVQGGWRLCGVQRRRVLHGHERRGIVFVRRDVQMHDLVVLHGPPAEMAHEGVAEAHGVRVREAAERDARADRRHVQRVAQRAAELGVEGCLRGGVAVDEDQAARLQLRHERRQGASVAQALHVDVQEAAPQVHMHRVAHELCRDGHGRRRRRGRRGIELRLLLGLESLALREPARRIDPLAVAIHAALALHVRKQADVHRIPPLAAEENVERHVVGHDGRHVVVVVGAVRLVRVLVRVSPAVHRAHGRRRRRHTLHVRTELVARERHAAAELQRQVATDARGHTDMTRVPCLGVRLRRVPAVPQRAAETRRIAPRGEKDHRLRVAQELGQQLARQSMRESGRRGQHELGLRRGERVAQGLDGRVEAQARKVERRLGRRGGLAARGRIEELDRPLARHPLHECACTLDDFLAGMRHEAHRKALVLVRKGPVLIEEHEQLEQARRAVDRQEHRVPARECAVHMVEERRIAVLAAGVGVEAALHVGDQEVRAADRVREGRGGGAHSEQGRRIEVALAVVVPVQRHDDRADGGRAQLPHGAAQRVAGMVGGEHETGTAALERGRLHVAQRADRVKSLVDLGLRRHVSLRVLLAPRMDRLEHLEAAHRLDGQRRIHGAPQSVVCVCVRIQADVRHVGVHEKHRVDRRSKALERRGQVIGLEREILRRAAVQQDAALIDLDEVR